MRGACAGDPACLWCPDGVPALGRGKGLWALARPAGRQRVAPAPGVAARRGARWAPPACRGRPDGVPAVGPRGAGRWALASFLLRQVGVSKLSDKARGTCASRVAAASCVWNAHACDISVCTCSPSCGQRGPCGSVATITAYTVKIPGFSDKRQDKMTRQNDIAQSCFVASLPHSSQDFADVHVV